MSNKNNNLASPELAINHIEPSNQPLVKPVEVTVGQRSGSIEKAAINNAISAGLMAKLSERAEADKTRLIHQSACAAAIADYYKAMSDTEAGIVAGEKAKGTIEEATGIVSRAFADAVLADAFDRVTVRRKLGEAFGFELSKQSGKPTSKPVEPGNTIAKRVSSVTIAAEYAMTGQLPDKGGDNLPLVGQPEVQDMLSDYFSGIITVRAASERIEKAIKDAKINLPTELSADKLLKLAGKIETASKAIVMIDDELREAYATLFAIIAAIPFPE